MNSTIERIKMLCRQLWDNTPMVTRNLLAISFIAWLADAVLMRMGIHLSTYLGLVNIRFGMLHGGLAFHIWQPLTYMFMHAGFSHWFFNMFAIWMFGMAIEREWGPRKYLFYYLACGLGAALCQEIVWQFTGGGVTIGASGAVFGILAAFAWLFPEQKIFLLFIPIPIPARWFVGMYAVLELFGGVASMSGDNIAHFAHLGGMITGLLILWYWKNKNNRRFRKYESKDYSGYHYKDPS